MPSRSVVPRCCGARPPPVIGTAVDKTVPQQVRSRLVREEQWRQVHTRRSRARSHVSDQRSCKLSVEQYEGKAQITEYARERVPTIVIQPAFYARRPFAGLWSDA